MCAGKLQVHSAMWISSAMSAAAPPFSVATYTPWGTRIWRSQSECFIAGDGYIPTAVLSSAQPRPMVTIYFLRSTVCHTWVLGLVIPEAATVAMLGTGLVESWKSVATGLGDM